METGVGTIVACDLSRVRNELRQFSGLKDAFGIVRKELPRAGDQRSFQVKLLYPFFVERLLVVIPESDLMALAQASDAGSDELGANVPGILLTFFRMLGELQKSLRNLPRQQ